MKFKKTFLLIFSSIAFVSPFMDIKSLKAENLMQEFQSQEMATWENAEYIRNDTNLNGDAIIVKYYIDKNSNIYKFINIKKSGEIIGPDKIGNLKEKQYSESDTCFFGTNYDCLSNIIRTTTQYALQDNTLLKFSRSDNLKFGTQGDVEKVLLGKKIIVDYIGEVLDGEPHGRGTFTYSDGDIYEGDWINGKWHGKGIHTKANGDKYVGDFIDGNKQGKGIYTWSSGSKYEGDWINGKWHGKGIYTFANNQGSYEGDFVDGNFTGKGTFIYRDKGKYIGDLLDGKRQGKGILYMPNGDKYEGDFVDNNFTGYGKFTSNRGKVKEGKWLNWKRIK